MIATPISLRSQHGRTGPEFVARWDAVFVATSLSRSSGGPFLSVSGLARAVAGRHDNVSVVGSYADRSLWPEDRSQWSATTLEAIPYHGLRTAIPLRRCVRSALERNRRSGIRTLIHLHGIWDAGSLSLAFLPDARLVPLVVSPRGMLEPWALRQRHWKKAVAMRLWQWSLLTEAGLLHATSNMECEGLRRLGLRNPVAVVPNGIDVPVDAIDLREFGSKRKGHRRCVFLSRLHPKKGVPMLLKAWSRVRPGGWSLEIAGSAEMGHDQELRDLIRRLQLDNVSLVGDLRGPAKWRFLAGAELFVLPSYSENFGIAVAEALAMGLPVITTRGTPWQAVRDGNMGWWIEADEESLANALREATLESPEQLRDRGDRGRAHALSLYGWSAIGARMRACYEWLLGIGPPPNDIVFA